MTVRSQISPLPSKCKPNHRIRGAKLRLLTPAPTALPVRQAHPLPQTETNKTRKPSPSGCACLGPGSAWTGAPSSPTCGCSASGSEVVSGRQAPEQGWLPAVGVLPSEVAAPVHRPLQAVSTPKRTAVPEDSCRQSLSSCFLAISVGEPSLSRQEPFLSSGLSAVDRRVELAELDAGVGGGELPVGLHAWLRSVAAPSRTRCSSSSAGRRPAQAGPAPSTLSSISAMFSQTAVLGRVVDLQLVGQIAWPPGGGTPRTGWPACACSGCPSPARSSPPRR